MTSGRLESPKVCIFDVDGVLTPGDFFYTTDGKVMKVFGPDDNDALSILKDFLEVRFVSGDKRGFEITRKRVEVDMKFRLDLVSTIKRIDWINELYDPAQVIYMGDGMFDHYVMNKVGYSIAPANSHAFAKNAADFVTESRGGDRAVAEACLHIMEKFFTPFNPGEMPKVKGKMSGEWTV